MSKKAKNKQSLLGYCMITPFYLIFLFIYLIPLLETVWNGFTDRKAYETPNFIGFDNYIRIFKDKVFGTAVCNTIVYVVFYLSIVMVLGLCLALLVNSSVCKMGIFRSAFFIPYITSMVVASMVWVWLYDTNKGFINNILSFFGIDKINWLGDTKWAMIALIIMSIWKNVGYNMLVNLGALQGVSTEYYEAARVDGANKWQQFWSITFPLIRPTTFFLFITGLISSFNVFEQVNLMTGGGPMRATTTVVHQIYTQAFTRYKMGYASAQSTLLLLALTIPVILYLRYGEKKDDLSM